MSATMRAAVYHGPQDLRLEHVPLPEIGPGEILLRVEAASICGTDLRIYHGAHRLFPPGTVRIPGHEAAGRIAGLGEQVSGYAVGQKVFVAPNMGCGHCRQCVSGNNNRCPAYQALGVTLDGAFAEWVRIPAAAVSQGCVMPIAEDLDPAAAALIEPFACVLRGQKPLAIAPGDRVLVFGAGPIGIMHILLARLKGAARIWVSDPNAARARQAAQFGADRVIIPPADDLSAIIAEESGGEGADVIIVAAPAHAAQQAALGLAAIGGRISFFGGLPKDKPSIEFNSNLVHYRELLVSGTTACSTADCREAADILSSGRVDLSGLISLRLPLEEAAQAFEAAESGRALKVVFVP